MLIKTFNLTKKYGKKTALHKLNLQIDNGQLVAYLGTNGAGKSTTISLLTGLRKPTSGEICYASNLKIGVVFQDSVLDKDLSVKQNLFSRARMYHHYDQEWIDELIEVIGLKKFLTQKYGHLSGGQRRRVDITRALIDHPNLLFLDEPTTGLDLQTRLAIWQLLQKLQKEAGLTIFLTTHYLEEAENADQMYILENGNLLASGSASAIKDKYAPNKLLLKSKHPEILSKKLSRQDVCQSVANNQISVMGLRSEQVIELLQENKANITDFEYEPGTIDDAFIKVTGKELQ